MIIFQLLTNFLAILIHSFWFSVFVEEPFTVIKAINHFCLSTECSQHNTGEQTKNKHGVKLLLCYRAETPEAAALSTVRVSNVLVEAQLLISTVGVPDVLGVTEIKEVEEMRNMNIKMYFIEKIRELLNAAL